MNGGSSGSKPEPYILEAVLDRKQNSINCFRLWDFSDYNVRLSR